MAYDGYLLPIKSAKIKGGRYLLQFVDTEVSGSLFYCSISGNKIPDGVTDVEEKSDEVE